MNHVLLTEIHDQLLLLVRTINAAKNNEYLTESQDLDDVKTIVRHERVARDRDENKTCYSLRVCVNQIKYYILDKEISLKAK